MKYAMQKNKTVRERQNMKLTEGVPISHKLVWNQFSKKAKLVTLEEK